MNDTISLPLREVSWIFYCFFFKSARCGFTKHAPASWNEISRDCKNWKWKNIPLITDNFLCFDVTWTFNDSMNYLLKGRATSLSHPYNMYSNQSFFWETSKTVKSVKPLKSVVSHPSGYHFESSQLVWQTTCQPYQRNTTLLCINNNYDIEKSMVDSQILPITFFKSWKRCLNVGSAEGSGISQYEKPTRDIYLLSSWESLHFYM